MLSVAIVCRDNESTIGRTLESVRGLAGEIVALDSGSTDGTLALLREHGARVIETEWKGHVSTKQLALEACTGEWILSLDSDESLEPDLRTAVAEVIERNDASIAGYRVRRKVFYRGRFLEHAWQPEWRLRLVRRGRARWGGLDPHDKLSLVGGEAGAAGRVLDLPGTLRHDSFLTFAEHLSAQARHARTMAESMRREGRRGSLARLVTSPVGAFLKQIVVKQAWRDGLPGWLAAGSTAAGTLMKHMILLESGLEGEEAGSDGPRGPDRVA